MAMKARIALLAGLSVLALASCIDLLDLGLGAKELMHDLTDRLEIHYPFEGDLTDASGNGNHGTAHGTVWHFSVDRFGGNGSTLDTGSSSYVDMNWGEGFNPAGAFSVNFWVMHPEAVIQGGQLYLFGVASATYPPVGVRFFMRVDDDTGSLRFEMNSSGLGDASDSLTFNTLWDELKSGADWHMVTLVHEAGTGADKLRLYVDGVERAPSSTTGNYGTGTLEGSIYLLGARQLFDTTALGMTEYTIMDDFRFYRRVLDSVEITGLYHDDGYDL